MDVKYINPFIKAFTDVIPQLGFESVEKGSLSLKEENLVNTGVVIIVGIVGDIKGNVVYTVDMEGAKKVASTMMMGMEVKEFDEIAQSALSELANMLTASAATAFSEMGTNIDISTPTLLHGDNISMKMNSNQVLCIEFLVDSIPMEINISYE